MIAIYIVGDILLFFVILLLIPISAEIGYIDSFLARIKYGGIKIFDTVNPKKEKLQKGKPKSDKKEKSKKPEKENFITRIFKEKGKIGGLKFCFAILKAAMSRIIWVIKRITIKEMFLDVTISTDDAATTAVTYGTVCAFVYPVIAIIKGNTKIGVSEINISTDFDKLSPEIKGKITFKTRLVYAVVAAISLLFAYFRIKKESEKNER